MNGKKRKSRLKEWSLTILPEGGEEVDWPSLSRDETTEKLKELGFPNPRDLEKVLRTVKFEVRKNKQGEPVYGTIEKYGGQLELGTKNGKPHYQMWINTSHVVYKGVLASGISQAVYSKEISGAINVTGLSLDSSDYKEYCVKEDRANLPGDYEHYELSSDRYEVEKYFEENPQLKKWRTIHTDTRNG